MFQLRAPSSAQQQSKSNRNSHPKLSHKHSTRIFRVQRDDDVFVFIHVFIDSHAPNRPRRSATADNTLAVLRTRGAVVVVAVVPVPVVLMGFFTGFPAPAAEALTWAMPRDCCTSRDAHAQTCAGTASSTASSMVATASSAFFVGPSFHALCVCSIVLLLVGVYTVLELYEYRFFVIG